MIPVPTPLPRTCPLTPPTPPVPGGGVETKGRLPGRVVMRHLIHRENIRHFRSLLATTSNENERQIILKLLAEEEAKYDGSRRLPEPPAARASRSFLVHWKRLTQLAASFI